MNYVHNAAKGVPAALQSQNLDLIEAFLNNLNDSGFEPVQKSWDMTMQRCLKCYDSKLRKANKPARMDECISSYLEKGVCVS